MAIPLPSDLSYALVVIGLSLFLNVVLLKPKDQRLGKPFLKFHYPPGRTRHAVPDVFGARCWRGYPQHWS